MQKCMHLRYHPFMVALQIRDVPDSVRDLLVQEAQRREQSLQAFLFDIVSREASAARNRALLQSLRERSRSNGTGVNAEEIIAAIADARESRET